MREVIGTELPVLLGLKRTRLERAEVDFGLDSWKQPTGVLAFLFLYGEVICLEIPKQFLSVGQAFVEFESVTDEEAIADLQSVQEEA